MVTGLDHVQIAMPAGEEDRARAFYVGIVGLQEVEKPASLAVRGGCWFVGQGAHVHLGVAQDFKPATKAHPAFTVKSLAELQKALEDGGYQVIPDHAVEGMERFYTHDPFGNRIEFIQDGQGFAQTA